ncbi:CehA/McbA family metallohydrolase [Elongatibacter sediminis]|uniref:LpqB family beta-propeller domain-containing protein n=1 Tax=Elongatibacter sediminis TaxID=3119006 RepID=A0AAW9RDJ1_9GAMM
MQRFFVSRVLLSVSLLAAALASPATRAQWTHTYPPVDGFNHQVYLEGFELPMLNAGPMDPAPSPDGGQLAFAAYGWLWLMDVADGKARRITRAAGMDSRPEWSPDGERLVFIRDSGRQLSIVQLDVTSGVEQVLVDVEAVNLDPVYDPDGRYVYYASADGGPLEIWRVKLESLERQPVTNSDVLLNRPLKRRPLLLDSDSLLLYLDKQGTRDAIKLLNRVTGEATTLVEDRITAQADLALSPDGRNLAYVWPYDGGWELRLLTLNAPGTSVLLTQSLGMPLAPAFSHDGEWVYFAEAGADERTALKRVRTAGGTVEPVAVGELDWGAPTGRLVVRTEIDGQPVAARLNAVDSSGHPVIPETGAVRFEGQHARVFWYSDGEITLLAPAGPVTVSAVHGLETPQARQTIDVPADGEARLTLELERVWNAAENGWYAADNHFHLNYGGPYRLAPEDILPDLRGEAMALGYPLLANLHNRFLQQGLWGWRHEETPQIHFGQEVRSHFLGHLQLLGIDTLFWPWIWGPFYEVYANDDRPNATALRHARSEGGVGGYVHPVGVADPFSETGINTVPIGFVADAVLGEVDVIELACLWTDEIGTAALWHAVLNLGIPLAASAGSDVMNNYYRTFAIGSTRVYVNTGESLNHDDFLDGLRDGRSFISNGPLLEFTVTGQGPGSALEMPAETVEWSLSVHSALPYDAVEIFVNGVSVQKLAGSDEAGSADYSGTIESPAGGWITARVTGASASWPALDSYLYAETSPVWFHAVGSIEPEARRRSAADLLRVLNASETRLIEGYGNTPIPDLLGHFQNARVRLREMAE